MASNFTLPHQYGYVALTAAASVLVGQWHGMTTSSFRRQAKVPYPNAYATAAECKESKEKYLFNCAQRAHANFLEHYPQMLVTMMVGGLRYPVISACMGVAWCAARVVYAVGYTDRSKENGSGRRIGTVFYIPELAMLIMSGLTGYNMLIS